MWPTQPHIQWVPWFFAGGRAARAEVNSERICTSAPPVCRDGVDKDDFSYETQKRYSSDKPRSFFMLSLGLHRRVKPIYSYSKPTICTCYLKLFILVKRSTCFGLSFRPSSGAQNCVYSSGICQTTAATCCQAAGSSSCLTYTVAVYAVLSS